MTAATFESVTGPLTAGPLRAIDPIVQTLATSAADGCGPAYIVVSDARTRDERRIWTEGGGPIGDDIDARAVADGWHGFDFMAVSGRHCLTQTRGQLRIYVYPLRGVSVDLDRGARATAQEIKSLGVFVKHPDVTPQEVARTPWLGFGPLLRSAPAGDR